MLIVIPFNRLQGEERSNRISGIAKIYTRSEIQMPTPEERRDISNPPLTPEQRSYEQGYTQGRGNENELQQRERAAENGGVVSGLAIGGILAALVGLGAYYYWAQPKPTPTTIINIPPVPATSAPAAPQKETKIIERTIEKAAPATPPKVVEVPTPILVPGTTRVIEVPKPFAVPVVPATPPKSDPPKDGSSQGSATPTDTPNPAASDSSPAPNSPDPKSN
jgi:hypothetical protein